MLPLRHLVAALLCTGFALGQELRPLAAEDTKLDATYLRDLAKERAGIADELRTPDGWLTLVALQWLKEGETTVGSGAANMVRLDHAPAELVRLQQHNGVVRVGPHESSLRMDGKAVANGAVVTPDKAELRSGGLLMTVISRGDRKYLRVKDADAPTRLNFHGLNWYPPSTAYRIVARWIPNAAGQRITIPNVLGQTFQEKSPGVAEFVVDGKTVRLSPLGDDKSLFFIFSDLTSRSTTYGAGRFLTMPGPDHGVGAPGTVVLDFNRATNPPCAYTPYATCPLPPAGNRLAVAIPAGEKRYAP